MTALLIKDRKDVMQEVVNAFKEKDRKKTAKRVWGNFRLVEDDKKLIYRDTSPKQNEDVIAIKTDNYLIGNAAVMQAMFAHRGWGNNQALIQSIISEDRDFVMVPFNVFEQANLDLHSFAMVDKGPEETFQLEVTNPKYSNYNKHLTEQRGGTYDIPAKIKQERHFIGAMLFNVSNSNGKTSQFLFDVDRNEIEHNIFNPFLVELPNSWNKTIHDAYGSLIPYEVKREKDRGKEVLRQGEWFLVKQNEDIFNDLEIISDKVEKEKLNETLLGIMYNHLTQEDRWKISRLIDNSMERKWSETDQYKKTLQKYVLSEAFTLRAGPNRPNRAEKGFKLNNHTYVSGCFSHTGREHHDLNLEGWYEAIPNRAVKSVTVTGDID